MCSIENCNLESYKDSNKCILHCEKDNFTDLESFNKEFRKYLKRSVGIKDFHFPIGFDLTNINLEFDKCTFYGFSDCSKHIFIECTFNKSIKILGKSSTSGKSKIFERCIFKSKRFKIEDFAINFNNFNECIFSENSIFFIKNSFINNCKIAFERIENISTYYFVESNIREELYLKNLNHLKKLIICDSEVSLEFKIKDCKHLKVINLKNSTFESKCKIVNSNLSYLNLTQTKFKELAGFDSTKIRKSIFRNTRFHKLVRFNKTEFLENVNFDYTYFLENSLFTHTKVIKKINLEKTFFKEIPNFLHIKSECNKEYDIKVYNRETARIIKDSFEEQNNIIEANKFYAIEMQEREDELSWKDNFFDKLVFKAHGLSSNHSQNWLLPIFWIVFFGLLNSYFQPLNFYTMNYVDVLYKEFFVGLLASLTTFVFLLSLIQHKIYYNYVSSFFIILFVYLVFTNDIYFSDFANSVNPFSIMTKGEELTFGILIYKIILAYLIYQLIISIRQNTRRK